MDNKKFNKMVIHIVTVLNIFIIQFYATNMVFAGNITTTTFTPLIDLIYVVLKVAGAIIALIGFAKLVLSFANDQPDSRFSSSMQMITGVALFFADGILGTLGIAL